MAKPFYSMDEVTALLGKTPDQVKELVRSNKLREFRDAGKVFFKSEEVDKLRPGGAPPASPGGSGADLMLEPADEELPSLAPSSGGTSVIGLQPVQDEPEDKREGTAVTSSGIGVFDDEEVEIDADPLAKTTISEGPVSDQVSLEGSGSGSGLLDLTRESDDTSLGAELLDEIYPGEEEAVAAPPARRPAPEPVAETAAAEPEPVYEVPVPVTRTVTYVVTSDPADGMMGGLLVGALLLLVFAGTVVGALMQGFVPDYVAYLSDKFWFFIGGAVLLPVLGLLIGWVIGRAAAPKAV